jgi:hypothetical protein
MPKLEEFQQIKNNNEKEIDLIKVTTELWDPLKNNTCQKTERKILPVIT